MTEKPPHVAAARWAQVYVIAPATADLLARLTAGAAAEPGVAAGVDVPGAAAGLPGDERRDVARRRRAAQRRAPARARGRVPRARHGHLAEGYDAIGRLVEPEAIGERALQLAAGV